MKGSKLVLIVLAAHFFLSVLIPQSQVGLDLVKATTGVYYEAK